MSDYQSLDEEAKYLVEQLRKQAAGRICEVPREEREAAVRNMTEFCEERIRANKLASEKLPELRGRKASERVPFL